MKTVQARRLQGGSAEGGNNRQACRYQSAAVLQRREDLTWGWGPMANGWDRYRIVSVHARHRRIYMGARQDII